MEEVPQITGEPTKKNILKLSTGKGTIKDSSPRKHAFKVIPIKTWFGMSMAVHKKWI